MKALWDYYYVYLKHSKKDADFKDRISNIIQRSKF